MSQSTGDRNRTCDLLVKSQTQLPTVATPDQVERRTERWWLSLRQARGRGFEPLSPDSKSGSLPLADPRIRFIESAMRESNPLSSLEGWRLCRSANGTVFYCSGRSESRTRKALSVLGRFRGGCHHQLDCPSVFLSSGGRNRTCTHPLNRRLPYRLATPECCGNAESGRSDLNRRSRGSGPRGIPDFPTS